MIELVLIGIGTGNPEHLTLQAIREINRADLILIPRKGAGKADLAELRRDICRQVLTNPATRLAEFDMPVRDSGDTDYLGRVDAWHDAIARVWSETIRTHLPGGGVVALLVWGDPSLYDSTLRIADRLSSPLPFSGRVGGGDAPDVSALGARPHPNPSPEGQWPDLAPVTKLRSIPALMSLNVLAAAHAIGLNEIGAPFLVTTGRRLRESGWPDGVETIVVMLDGACAFQQIDPQGVTIYWAAYLGMADEILISGPLARAGPEILAARSAARARHGWIMDIYLLRRDDQNVAVSATRTERGSSGWTCKPVTSSPPGVRRDV